ncbi:hypothetical protein LIA77_08756 [Sarocladium implicatum]|nr:hypothetical protein LIA77_08756 [Sarocladium implicatum]
MVRYVEDGGTGTIISCTRTDPDAIASREEASRVRLRIRVKVKQPVTEIREKREKTRLARDASTAMIGQADLEAMCRAALVATYQQQRHLTTDPG